nr:hypothetical protein [Mesorhizobium sp. Root157]
MAAADRTAVAGRAIELVISAEGLGIMPSMPALDEHPARPKQRSSEARMPEERIKDLYAEQNSPSSDAPGIRAVYER